MVLTPGWDSGADAQVGGIDESAFGRELGHERVHGTAARGLERVHGREVRGVRKAGDVGVACAVHGQRIAALGAEESELSEAAAQVGRIDEGVARRRERRHEGVRQAAQAPLGGVASSGSRTRRSAPPHGPGPPRPPPMPCHAPPPPRRGTSSTPRAPAGDSLVTKGVAPAAQAGLRGPGRREVEGARRARHVRGAAAPSTAMADPRSDALPPRVGRVQQDGIDHERPPRVVAGDLEADLTLFPRTVTGPDLVPGAASLLIGHRCLPGHIARRRNGGRGSPRGRGSGRRRPRSPDGRPRGLVPGRPRSRTRSAAGPRRWYTRSTPR
jgi:hypothetical protein